MKTSKTAVIPIFISHRGCPNDCAFCNQRRISGADGQMQPFEVCSYVEAYLKTIPSDTRVEIAFYGGSFTGIEPSLQESFLENARRYKTLGRVKGIRLSTRPDYLDASVMDRLKLYQVDLVELGCQSFSDEVLLKTNRGHKASSIYNAVDALKRAGIGVGIQLMLGLPGDTKALFKASVDEAAKLKPEVVRLYPTLVVKDTLLAQWYEDGLYRPMALDLAIDLAAYAYNVMTLVGSKVIRMGLQKTDEIEIGKGIVAGPFHPAFGELVLGRLYQWCILEACGHLVEETIVIEVAPECFSWVKGHQAHWSTPFKQFMASNDVQVSSSKDVSPFVIRIKNKNTTEQFSVLSENRGNHVFKEN